MSHPVPRPVPRPGRRAATLVLAVVLAAGAFAAAAVASGFTLKVTKHATVQDSTTGQTSHANVIVNGRGFVVYMLTGDRKSHPQCTSKACLQFWPPVKVKSAKSLSRSAAVKGKLGTWKHKGFTQVTLNGHPLYLYLGDTKAGKATGEGIINFGGTWHVMLASGKAFADPTAGGGGGY